MRTHAVLWKTLTVPLICLAFALPLAAQGVGGIGGSVVDASGAALPGVTVALVKPGRDRRRPGNDDRLRAAPTSSPVSCPARMPFGPRCPGFRTALQQRIVVNADTTARVDLKLEIGALEETITVSGQSPLSTPQDAEADGHDARNARRAAGAERHLGDRAHGAGCGHEQVRRRRVGDVLAVVRRSLRQHARASGPTPSTGWTSPGPAARDSSSATSTRTCSKR